MAVGGLFSAFFFALMLMLAFSSGVILYGSLFRSREIAFLLTTPARTGRVFLHKFQEAILLSSWGFVLLGSPALLAYGVVVGAPWYYYALLPPFIVAFIYIPVAIGAILCMLIVRYFPDRIMTILIAAGVLLLAGGAWMGWRVLTGPKNDLLTPGWFQEILGRMQVSDQRLLPSWWLSTGLLAAADRTWSECVLFLTLMISNALFFRQLTLWTAERLYRPAYSGLFGKLRRRKRPRSVRLDRLLSRLMGWLAGNGAADDDQGFPTLSPRSLAVVADSDLRRLSDPLLSLHPFLQLQHVRRQLGEHGQFSEPRGRGAVAVHLYHPLRLSHDQP